MNDFREDLRRVSLAVMKLQESYSTAAVNADDRIAVYMFHAQLSVTVAYARAALLALSCPANVTSATGHESTEGAAQG